MSLASMARDSLHRRRALLATNIGVLGQKLDFMTALRNTLGPKEADQRFAQKCPIVGASVGQHFRHSTDHMECVANSIDTNMRGGNDHKASSSKIQLHYDIRVRGGDDENDMDAAEERIRRVTNLFQKEFDALVSSSLVNNKMKKIITNNETVLACFMLSGDPRENEFLLSSTLERELGFVAHHAIHHMAMVKIITMYTLKFLPPDVLPEGFGMAPSTIAHGKSRR